MKHLEAIINTLFNSNHIKNIAIRVGKSNDILYELYRCENGTINEDTLFDMASVSKILATTTLSLIALDKGLIRLDDTVDKFFEGYDDKKNLTVFNLLTHTIGIGHKSLNTNGNTYDNIAEVILKIPCDIPTGSDVLYSCPGFILLGKILEKVFGEWLDILFKKHVCSPLNMTSTTYLPANKENVVNSNFTNSEIGMVNDYNCRFLGGVAGNAGVFSNINDLTKFAHFLLNKGAPLISKNTFNKAIQNHTPNMSEARALGYVYVDERYKQTSDLFSTGSIGHCGHTGQSVFVDFNTGLYVIILSDATKSIINTGSTDNYYDKVMHMRAQIHHAIKQDLE